MQEAVSAEGAVRAADVWANAGGVALGLQDAAGAARQWAAASRRFHGGRDHKLLLWLARCPCRRPPGSFRSAPPDPAPHQPGAFRPAPPRLTLPRASPSLPSCTREPPAPGGLPSRPARPCPTPPPLLSCFRDPALRSTARLPAPRTCW